MSEPHHHILRQTCLCLVSQAQEEGMRVSKNHILTCAVTAKNSVGTVGNSTPLQAAFGTQPSVLPNLEDVVANLDDSNTGPGGLS